MASRPRAPAPSGLAPSRPLSPHLSIWKWKVHMAASIFHRATGNAMAFGAVLIFAWWLMAAASGPRAYDLWHGVATGWFGILVGVGFTWVFFQHMGSGVRHLIMDGGKGLEIRTSKTMATAVFLFAPVMTALVWGAVALSKGI